MLKFFRIWLGAIHVLIGVQFFLAGYGALGTGDTAEAFSMHIMGGRLIGAFSLLAILFAALARAGGKLVGMAAGVFGLAFLQFLIAMVSVGGTVPGQIIFGFHAVNALMVVGLVEATSRHVKKIIASREEAGSEAVATAATT